MFMPVLAMSFRECINSLRRSLNDWDMAAFYATKAQCSFSLQIQGIPSGKNAAFLCSEWGEEYP